MERRELLLTGSTVLTLSFAGCSGDSGDDRDTGDADNGNDREDGGTGGTEESGGDSDDGSADTNSGGSNDSGSPVEILEHEWYNEGSYNAGVRGRLENVSDETLSYVGVNVYFLDGEGVQIEEGLDNTTDLAAGRVWEFDASYLGDNPERVDSYEIEKDVTNY